MLRSAGLHNPGFGAPGLSVLRRVGGVALQNLLNGFSKQLRLNETSDARKIVTRQVSEFNAHAPACHVISHNGLAGNEIVTRTEPEPQREALPRLILPPGSDECPACAQRHQPLILPAEDAFMTDPDFGQR